VRTSPFPAQSSENPTQTKRIVKKLVSTLLATLAISIATLESASDLPAAVINAEGVSSVRLGLSRQRPAFRKAVSMLAEAAPKNQRLAGYYERVTRRVNGHDAQAEQYADGEVAITVRKTNPEAARIREVEPRVVDQTQAATQGLITVALAETISEPSYSDSTPVDSTNGSEPLSNPRTEFTVGDVAFDTNPAIERWINYYGASAIGRSTMKIGFERSSSYLEMARAEFRSAGVPEDLVWLAFVESVWNPRALSPAAAGGIWQFIPATATEYGLTVERGNDERADPFKQTRVAAAYLRDLYTIFGDWSLAMAAYNSGEPRVMGAIVRNGNANFWELSDKRLLPKETCAYVPKILATIRVASRAEDYGF
jgi:hypothetical protein